MKEKSLKKNIVMSILLTSSNFIFPLISYSYVARILSTDGTGKVAFVYSILSYFSYIALIGIPGYGLREVAKVRDNKVQMSKLVQELLFLNLISTVVSYILLFSTVVLVPRLYEERTLFLLMSSYIFLNTIGLDWMYQALEEYTYITVRSIAIKAISLVLTFLLVKSKDDVLWYGVLYVFTNSASNIINLFHARKYLSFKKYDRYEFKKHIKPILTLFSASIIITIYANFDVSMLGFISTENEVGLYNAALKIKSVVLSLSTAVTSVFVPRMAYYLKDGDKTKASSLIQKSTRVSLCLVLPVATYIFLYSSECVSLFCGSEFLGAVPTLRILLLCVFPLVITNLFGNQILVPSGNEKRYSQSVFVGLWINVILNAVLIPNCGSFGAAIGTFVTECWNVFWMSGGAKDYRKMLIKSINLFQYVLPLVFSVLSCITISKFLKVELIWELLITGTIFMTIYYGLLYLFKEPLLSEQTQNLLTKLRRRKQ